MTAPFWAIELSEHFWAGAGELEAFPRSLRRSIAMALPVALVLMPRLRLAAVQEWLRSRGMVCEIAAGERPLRACLIARYGHGIIFLDGMDAEDEQRFSLAHELAHFLLHYQRPRQRVAESLGERALEVLDGERQPTKDERIQALLIGVKIGFFVHLMNRTANESKDSIGVAERNADLLALELLAPSETVLEQLPMQAHGSAKLLAEQLLIRTYGLPPSVAARYAEILTSPRRSKRSFIDELGLA